MTTPEQVAQALHATIDPQKVTEATNFLNQVLFFPPSTFSQKTIKASKQPNYATILLQITTNANLPTFVRKGAAIQFKNIVKHQWDPSQSNTISEQEKEKIRQNLLPSLSTLPPELLYQLFCFLPFSQYLLDIL